jgi:hypothetical protein
MLAGYAPGATLARVEGDLLVVANGGQFPPVCVRCGDGQPIEWRDQRFAYVPPWARFLGVLVQAMVVKRSRFNLPVCSACNREWKKWNLILALSWIPGALFFVVATALTAMDFVPDARPAAEEAATLFFVLGLVVFLGLLFTAAILRQRRVVQASKIDKTYTWLKGVALQA